MKKITKILGLVTFILTTTTAEAQFGKLKSVAKDKAKEKATDKVLNNNKSSESSGTTTGNNQKPLELDWTTFKMTPAITMSSLLYGTQVSNSGNLRLTAYTASFIPNKKIDGSLLTLSEQMHQLASAKVYKDNTLVKEITYTADDTFEDNKLRKFNSEFSDINLKETGIGLYRVDFYAADKMFYTFDFEVYKKTNDDPYASMNELYLSKGPWNKYVHLEHQKSGNMIFGFYLMHEEFQPHPSDPNKTTKDVSWTVNITKDGAPFATHYDGINKPKISKVERGEWDKLSVALKSADGKKTIQLADFTDGAYKIELKVDGEEKPRIYSFEVANNKIVLMDEQDRTKNTDPTMLVEGWNNFFWFKQEN